MMKKRWLLMMFLAIPFGCGGESKKPAEARIPRELAVSLASKFIEGKGVCGQCRGVRSVEFSDGNWVVFFGDVHCREAISDIHPSCAFTSVELDGRTGEVVSFL